MRFISAGIGALQGTYRPYAYYGRVRDTPEMLRSVAEVVLIGEGAPASEVVERAMVMAEGVEFGRALANRASNDLYPERMAEVARELEADGCTVEVLDVDDMKRLGMGALLGVGQGAFHEPRLIAVKLPGWEKAADDRRLAIVGKGVCFDSGGISLKPPERMEEMKHDKSGAAAVIAAARTVARLAPETPLMAVAPMVENMPGGNAQRPGDVVKAMNGKTIEVINTDAEGRLILADALHWAETQGATHLVDVATLTGAAAMAFGELISAYFAKPRDWGQAVQRAADATGEWFWEMPLATEYRASLRLGSCRHRQFGDARGVADQERRLPARLRDGAVGARRYRRQRVPDGRQGGQPEGRAGDRRLDAGAAGARLPGRRHRAGIAKGPAMPAGP